MVIKFVFFCLPGDLNYICTRKFIVFLMLILNTEEIANLGRFQNIMEKRLIKPQYTRQFQRSEK